MFFAPTEADTSVGYLFLVLLQINFLQMKKIVDIDSWSRRDNYSFFCGYVCSWYSVATEIECGEAFRRSKAEGSSFFLRYLYAVLHAANSVEELRYRTDRDGRVVLYDKVDIITPIAMEGRSFVTVRIPYDSDFNRWCKTAGEIINSIKPDDDPYGVERRMVADDDYAVIHMSAVPDMHFTSITYTIAREGQACTHPLSTMGRAVKGPDGSMSMPYSIYVDHAFVDGEHLSRFFKIITKTLSEI